MRGIAQVLALLALGGALVGCRGGATVTSEGMQQSQKRIDQAAQKLDQEAAARGEVLINPDTGRPYTGMEDPQKGD